MQQNLFDSPFVSDEFIEFQLIQEDNPHIFFLSLPFDHANYTI